MDPFIVKKANISSLIDLNEKYIEARKEKKSSIDLVFENQMTE
jgi:hypothetical protein